MDDFITGSYAIASDIANQIQVVVQQGYTSHLLLVSKDAADVLKEGVVEQLGDQPR